MRPLAPQFLPAALAALLALPMVAHATESDRAKQIAERMTERMKSELSLNSEQVEKLREVNLAHVGSTGQMLAKYKAMAPGTRSGLAADAMAQRKTYEAELQKVLTPQQWSAYQAKKPERAADMQTEIMTAQLGLDEAQVAKVREINVAAATKMKAATGSQKFKDMGRRDKRQAARSLKDAGEARDQELQKVLTPDQWKTYSQNKEQMREALKQKMQESKAQ